MIQNGQITKPTQTLGIDHPHTLRAAVYYSNLLVKMGNLQEAIDCYMHHLALQQRVLGNDHPDVLTCCHNIGFCLLQLGRTRESVDYLQRCLHQRQQVLGEAHIEVLRTRDLLERAMATDLSTK
jgi:hypothetical protein